jgi:hypothetical protein
MSDYNVLKDFKQRLEEIGQTQPLVDWVLENIYLRSFPFTFDEHPELEQIYRDMHPLKVFRKSVQVGISTYAICLMLWLACSEGSKSMYCGPTDDWIREFSKDRVNKIIATSPEIKSRLGLTNTPFQKDIGFSTLYLHGLKSESKVTSADIDLLIVDETDIVDQENKFVAKDRLEHSNLAWYMQLSKPSVPGFGIDEAFEEGDQHYRFFFCPHCGKANNIIENIYQEPLAVLQFKGRKSGDLYYFACEKCGKPLDPANAEWVAKYPGRDIRSYHISQAYWTRKIAHFGSVAEKLYKAIVNANNLDLLKYFWRSLIGLAYAGDDQPLTDKIFNEMAGVHPLRPAFAGRSVMGVDQGEKLHVAIAHPQGYRLLYHWFEELDDFNQLYPLMKIHNVRMCYIDYKPNTHEAKKFALKFKKRVAVVDFTGEEIQEKETEKKGQKLPKINLPRTESLDEYSDCIKGGIAVLPPKSAGKVIVVVRKHHKKLIKERVKNAAGIDVYRYKHRVDNHYGMAGNYALQAWYHIQNKMTHGSGVLPVSGRLGNVTIH